MSLRFSASIDGKILEENMRPFKDKNKIRNDDWTKEDINYYLNFLDYW